MSTSAVLYSTQSLVPVIGSGVYQPPLSSPCEGSLEFPDGRKVSAKKNLFPN